MSDFFTAGTMPSSANAYCEREFEQASIDAIAAGRWVLVLGPRQHGKSSALVRISERLRDEGFSTGLLDLQAFAGEGSSVDYGEWLRRICTEVARQLGAAVSTPNLDQRDDAVAWLKANLRECQGSIALLFDEASAVPKHFRTRFYSQLRVLFNSRATSPEDSLEKRLALLFCGTFRPETMIDDENSPFNVCEVIHTRDLELAEAVSLASQAGDASLQDIAARAFAEVGGQPYLLQLLLDACANAADEDTRGQLFEAKLRSIRRGDDVHVSHLLRRLVAEEGAAELTAQVMSAPGGIPFSVGGLHSFLRIVGIAGVTLKDGRDWLVPRNRLYRGVILASPQFSQSAPQPSPGNPDMALVMEAPEAFGVIANETLRVLAIDGYRGGVNAYNAGDYRLALVSFGGTHEAILLDMLTQLTVDDRRTACSQVALQDGSHPSGRPAGWNYATMIDVAHATGRVNAAQHPRLSHAVREWRNLVHPDNAAKNYQEQSDLEPEARFVVFVITKLLQSLRQPTAASSTT